MNYFKLPSSEPQDSGDRSLEDGMEQPAQYSTGYKKRWFAVLWMLSLACIFTSTRWYYLSKQSNISPHVRNVAAFDYNCKFTTDLSPSDSRLT